MCVRIFAYCVHAKSAGISIKTSHEHLLLHCPAVPLKVAKFQVAKNKRIDRRFIYISDSLLSLTLPASDFHPSHRRGKCLACISLLFADSSARVLAPQACENHCKFSTRAILITGRIHISELKVTITCGIDSGIRFADWYIRRHTDIG